MIIPPMMYGKSAKSIITDFRGVLRRRTKSITDPAPMATNLEHRRHSVLDSLVHIRAGHLGAAIQCATECPSRPTTLPIPPLHQGPWSFQKYTTACHAGP